MNKINPKYHNLLLIIGFVIVFKVMAMIFYDSYYFFFNTIAPKFDNILSNKFGLEVYFLKIKPYLDFSFLISSFKSPTSYLGVIVFIYLYIYRKKIGWNNVAKNTYVKLFFILPGVLLCWELLTYDYNYYLDHYFLLERVLLVGTLCMVWVHPMYAVWFLIMAFLFRGQFDFPIGGFPLFDKKVLFDIYVLLISFLVIKTQSNFSKKWLPYLLLMLIASNYFATGIGKVIVTPHGYEWPFQNPLNYLLLNGRERGWAIDQYWIDLTTRYKVFFQCLIIILELSALSMFYKRKWTIILLLGYITMHFVILFSGGIFFWKWIAIDLFMLGFLIFYKTSKKIFNPYFFKWSLIIIPFGFLWANCFTIGWLDTKYNNIFQYEVVLKNGSTYNFPKTGFNPYHQLFFHDKFLYLIQDKKIKISGFGYTFKNKLATAINKSSVKDFKSLTNKYGIDFYDPVKEEEFTGFIKLFFHNYNEELDENWWRSLIKAPLHIYNSPPQPIYNKQDEIKTVNIYIKTTYVENNRVEVLEKKLIKSIDIE